MTFFAGAALVAAAVVLFILQPVLRDVHASFERSSQEPTETEARKRVALLALRDVEYDYLSGKLDDEDYRSLKGELTAEALAALEADDAAKAASVDGAPAYLGGDALEAEIVRVRTGLREGTVCGECGFGNPGGSRFCSSCGGRLVPAEAD